MYPTDDFKALSNLYNVSTQELRDFARDQGLQFRYSTDRRTWYLAERATAVRHFNEFLDEATA